MVFQILNTTTDPESRETVVTFEVVTQRNKCGRFTMPAEILRLLALEWNQRVRLSIAALDGRPLLPECTITMQSGPEIYSSELGRHVNPGDRISVTARRRP